MPSPEAGNNLWPKWRPIAAVVLSTACITVALGRLAVSREPPQSDVDTDAPVAQTRQIQVLQTEVLAVRRELNEAHRWLDSHGGPDWRPGQRQTLRLAERMQALWKKGSP